MKRTKTKLTEERDLPLLNFLWRWKVCSTQLLHQAFFAGRSPKTSYERLRELEAAKYIQRRSTCDGLYAYWQLSKKGFTSIKGSVDGISVDGFQPNSAEHDLIATGIHCEGWLQCMPDDADLMTEQELTCVRPETWSAWVPRHLARRPDGYWFRGWRDRFKVIALEVELHPKSKGWFREILAAYAWNEEIHAVIWVTQRPCIENRIISLPRPHDTGIGPTHTIISLDDVLANGWRATMSTPIDGCSSLAELLHPEGQTEGRTFGPLENLSKRKVAVSSTRCALQPQSAAP